MSDSLKLFGIGLLFLTAVCVIGLLLWFSSNGVKEWTQAISDPTERGLAYVAVAIAVHAFFGSGRKVEVDVKSSSR